MLLTAAQTRRRELNKAYDSAVAIRTSAHIHDNLPPETLAHVERACDELFMAIIAYNKVVKE